MTRDSILLASRQSLETNKLQDALDCLDILVSRGVTVENDVVELIFGKILGEGKGNDENIENLKDCSQLIREIKEALSGHKKNTKDLNFGNRQWLVNCSYFEGY